MRRALCLLVLALLACRPQPTALRVEVDADPALARYVQMVRVRVYAPPSAAQPVEQHDIVVGVGAIRWPLSFNITADASDQRVRVDVDGFREPSQDPDAAGLVRTRAITTFRAGKVLVLPLVFWSACRDTAALDCGLTETCSREGRCVSADVPEASLAEFMASTGDAGPACEAGSRALAGVCVTDDPPDAAPDASPDAAADAPADAVDAAMDARDVSPPPPDAPATPDVPDAQTPADATPDRPADAAPDAPADLGGDTSIEAPLDAAPDVSPDVSPDVAPDVSPDAAPDVPATPDAPLGATVTLVSPAHGAILSGPSPTLRWTQPAGPMSTFLQVCADPACATVEYGFLDRMGSNTHRVGTSLARGAHWWRVSTTGMAGPFTPSRPFEVRGQGAVTAALGTSPDFTSDGTHDLVVGLPGFFEGGQVWLYVGSPAGVDPMSPFLVTRSASTQAIGERLVNLGDMNGDGTTDLGVSSPVGGVDGPVLVLGGSATGLASNPAFRLDPSPTGGSTSFGESVAGVGDVNGDGLADALVGAPQFGSGVGRAWLFLGVRAGATPAATAIDPPTGQGGRFGNAVTALGDFNGDGLADFAVSATERLGGAVFVYLGVAAGLPRLAHTFESPAGAGVGFGARLAGGFDFDGDGLGDLAVNAITANTHGMVYIYWGAAGSRGTSPDDALAPPLSGEAFFGLAVAPGGDFNGDGVDDLLIAQGGRDHVHVVAGAPRSFSHRVLATVQRPSDGAGFFTTGYGKALAGMDLNRDGRRDFVVGAYNDAGGAGRVYVYLQLAAGIPSAPTAIINGPGGARIGSSFAAQ